MNTLNQLKTELGEVLTDEPLSQHITFKIGGPAKYFYIADIQEKLIKAVKIAKKLDLPYFILGGGSNILVSDQGFEGMVIKIQNPKLQIPNKLQIQNSKSKNFLINVGAGVMLSELIKETLDNNLVGLEFLAGIPGTVGGAVRGNAGAWGKSINEVIKEIEVFNPESHSSLSGEAVRSQSRMAGEITIITKQDADFSYRHSRFKEEGNKEIILSATLELSAGDVEQSRQQINEYLAKRKISQPLQYPSAGCVFKNIFLKDIGQPIVQRYELDKVVQCSKVGAGYLIQEAELKSKQVGGAQVSDQHANFIINKGNATAEDVITLISLVKQKIRNKFGVQLIEEIELVGFE